MQNACDQPAGVLRVDLWLWPFDGQPKIHRGGPEQERSKRRVPGAVKNVTRYDEQIFPGLPRTNAPEKSDNDHEKNGRT